MIAPGQIARLPGTNILTRVHDVVIGERGTTVAVTPFGQFDAAELSPVSASIQRLAGMQGMEARHRRGAGVAAFLGLLTTAAAAWWCVLGGVL